MQACVASCTEVLECLRPIVLTDLVIDLYSSLQLPQTLRMSIRTLLSSNHEPSKELLQSFERLLAKR
jgi:hypothetical protein